MIGLWVLLATLGISLAVGAVLRIRDGRIRTKNPIPSLEASPVNLPEPVRKVLEPGTSVTLVQISTTFCAPCRHARVILQTLADHTAGLRHVDIDVTNLPEVAQSLGILRTPTTLALDADGRELLRVGGVPKASSLLEALMPHLPQVSTGRVL